MSKPLGSSSRRKIDSIEMSLCLCCGTASLIVRGFAGLCSCDMLESFSSRRRLASMSSLMLSRFRIGALRSSGRRRVSRMRTVVSLLGTNIPSESVKLLSGTLLRSRTERPAVLKGLGSFLAVVA